MLGPEAQHWLLTVRGTILSSSLAFRLCLSFRLPCGIEFLCLSGSRLGLWELFNLMIKLAHAAIVLAFLGRHVLTCELSRICEGHYKQFLIASNKAYEY